MGARSQPSLQYFSVKNPTFCVREVENIGLSGEQFDCCLPELLRGDGELSFADGKCRSVRQLRADCGKRSGCNPRSGLHRIGAV